MADVIYAGDGGLFNTCSRCGCAKPVASYYMRKDGAGVAHRWCKDCIKADKKIRYDANADEIKGRVAQYRAENAESISSRRAAKSAARSDAEKQKKAEYNRRYQSENKDKIRLTSDKWRRNNIERARQYQRNVDLKKRSTPKGKLEHVIGANVRNGIRRGSKAGRKTFSLLGYTVDDLKAHLECQFQVGMTWENHGSVWHIDHKIPLAAFNYETPDHIDFKRAWALENLRPLWASENMSKGARMSEPFQPCLAI